MGMNSKHILLIGRIHALAHQWLTDELAAAGLTGLVPSHGDILACLLAHGPATMNQLATFAHRTRPTTTVLVDKLERLGYIARQKSPVDARSTIITLTPQGEALRPAFQDISNRLISLTLSGLSPQESETLQHLLDKTLTAMQTQLENRRDTKRPNKSKQHN